jgi:hypothetical protein
MLCAANLHACCLAFCKRGNVDMHIRVRYTDMACTTELPCAVIYALTPAAASSNPASLALRTKYAYIVCRKHSNNEYLVTNPTVVELAASCWQARLYMFSPGRSRPPPASSPAAPHEQSQCSASPDHSTAAQGTKDIRSRTMHAEGCVVASQSAGMSCTCLAVLRCVFLLLCFAAAAACLVAARQLSAAACK